jgi:hypothetical protein
MTVRREIAEPRRETDARSREDPMRTRAVRGGSERRARRPKACRSSGLAIAVEAFMNNAGEEGISEGCRLAESGRAAPRGVGATPRCQAPSPLSLKRQRRGVDTPRLAVYLTPAL